MKNYLTIVILSTFYSSFASPLILDAQFRPTVTAPYPGVAWGLAVYPLPDGRFYLIHGGVASINGEALESPVVRLDPNGNLDHSFRPGRSNSFPASDVGEFRAVQSDGKPLFVLSSTNADGLIEDQIMRLKLDGSVDLTFPIRKSVATAAVQTLKPLADGRFLVTQEVPDLTDSTVVQRYTASGALDETFQPFRLDYKRPRVGNVAFVMPLPDDKIILAGRFTNLAGLKNLLRLNADGTLDASFKVPEKLNAPVTRISTLPGGDILFGADGFYPDTAFVVVNSSGELKNQARTDPECPVIDFFPLASGKVLENPSCGQPPFLRRLTPVGQTDPSFKFAVTNTFPPFLPNVTPLAETVDGRVLIMAQGSSFLLMLNTNGSLDMSFRCELGEVSPPYQEDPGAFVGGIALQPDGRIVIAGAFSSINGVRSSGLARLNSDGTVDTSFHPDTSLFPVDYAFAKRTPLVIGSDGSILVAVGRSFFPGPSTTVIRYAPDGSAAEVLREYAAGAGSSLDQVVSLAMQSDGKILAAAGDSDASSLIRLESNGTPDATFRPAKSLAVSVTIQPSGKIVVADGNILVYRLEPDGTLDSNFNPWRAERAAPKLVASRSDGKIWVIALNYDDNSYVLGLVSENGALEGVQPLQPFQLTGYFRPLLEATAAGTDLLLGGQFIQILGRTRLGLARLTDAASFSQPRVGITPGPIMPTLRRVSLQSVPGTTLSVETSNDLIRWSPVATVTVGDAGYEDLVLDDTASAEFFRTVQTQ